MNVALNIAVLTIAFALMAFAHSRLVGIYGLSSEIMRSRILMMQTVGRVDGELYGYVDALGVFHSHYYRAVVIGSEQQIEFFSFFPDAFGTPFGDQINGRRIVWRGKPERYGVLLHGSKVLLL